MRHDELDAKIAALATTVKGSFFDSGRRDGLFWQGVWSEIREIGQEFREVRYPTKAGKDAAWAAFQGVVADVKEQRDEHFRNRERKDEESNRLLGEVLGKAQAAWPHEDGFMEFLGMITGATILAEVMLATIEVMVDILTFGLLRTEETDPRKAKLLACSSHMKDAWAYFKAHSRQLLPHHRDAAWKALTGVQGELDKEWEAWKAEQRGRRAEREHRIAQNREAKQDLIREARGLLGSHRDPNARRRAKELFQEWRSIKSAGKTEDDALWQEFRGTLDEFFSQSQEEFQRRREEHRERQENYRQHVMAEIEKIEGMIEKARANRDANEERLDSARTDEYADRVREWIEDDDAKIERFEGWLAEWREKLEHIDD